MPLIPRKTFSVTSPRFAYKWARNWGKIQLGFFEEDVALRRQKQVLDFARLNGYERLYIMSDTDAFDGTPTVQHAAEADLVVLADQRFSRLSCGEIIHQIEHILTQCPNLYLCLNRHYINTDNTFRDSSLDNNFNRAITQWLVKSLPHHLVIDLSLDYLDCGDWFTWVIPDRHYFIQ